MDKAIFLDRDGVINKEKHYLYKIEDFEFIDGVFDSLKYCQDLGYKLFIITNQSDIGRGYYTNDDFDILTSWMLDKFAKNSITISQVECCPHAPSEKCRCRKPDTLMVENILQNFDIDLEQSYLVGDKDSDILCAINSGIKNTIQVKTGHKFDLEQSKATYVVDSIKDIKNIIKE